WYCLPVGVSNGADYYGKAFKALRLKTPAAASLPLVGNGQLPPVGAPVPAPMKPALAALLESNRQALQWLAQGAQCEACRYPLDLSRGFALVYTPIQKLEQATFLLALAALDHADSHQPAQAANDLFTAFALADSLVRIPTILPQLLRRRIDTCALDALE